MPFAVYTGTGEKGFYVNDLEVKREKVYLQTTDHRNTYHIHRIRFKLPADSGSSRKSGYDAYG